MKNLLLLTLLVTGLIIAGCRKDNDNLPPETQTGANTFGCLVNGKVFVPKGSDGYSGQNKTAVYQHIYASPSGYVFQLSATDYENTPLLGLDFGVDSLKVLEGVVYKIRNGNKAEFGAQYMKGVDFQNTFIVRDDLQGEIVFKKFDEVNQIASGTFWFDAVNSLGEKVEVREGRFDVKYTR